MAQVYGVFSDAHRAVFTMNRADANADDRHIIIVGEVTPQGFAPHLCRTVERFGPNLLVGYHRKVVGNVVVLS